MIAPARTGRERSRRIAVISTDHTKRGTRSIGIPFVRMLIVVVIKFSDARIDETPAKCREKIARSTEGPA